MADFVLARKSRNIASSAVHVFLNILLGLSAVLLTVFSGNPAPGLILILISKWRVFAVRSRYLWTNIKSNLVDFIVGFSVVLLAYFAGKNLLPVDFILIGLYTIWLLFIKPRSSEIATLVQSLIAVLLGISAISILTVNLDATFSVVMAFLVGYAACRHVLVQTSDKDFTLTTLICGLVFAEIMWFCHFWAIDYSLSGTGIRVPQAALILTIFAFVYNYARQAAIRAGEDFHFRDVLGPVLFGLVLIVVIVVWFSEPVFNV